MAFWIKRWGTRDHGYDDEMLTDFLEFGDPAAPRGVPKVRKDDLLIVTGTKTRGGALVAVAKATTEVLDTKDGSQWHWRCGADFYHKCPAAIAPRLSVMPDPDGSLRDWHTSPDGLHPLTAEQFQAAEAAIKSANHKR